MTHDMNAQQNILRWNQVARMAGRDFFRVATPEDIILCYDLADRAATGFGKGQNSKPFTRAIISLRSMYGLGPIPDKKIML